MPTVAFVHPDGTRASLDAAVVPSVVQGAASDGVDPAHLHRLPEMRADEDALKSADR